MATIFNNISPNGENRRLMLIDAWAEDPLTVDMMNHPVNGDKVAVRSHNSLNEIVVDSVKVYDNGSWVDEGGGSVNPSPAGTVVYDGTFSTAKADPGDTSAFSAGLAFITPIGNYDDGIPDSIHVKFKLQSSDADYTEVDLPKVADQDLYGKLNADFDYDFSISAVMIQPIFGEDGNASQFMVITEDEVAEADAAELVITA